MVVVVLVDGGDVDCGDGVGGRDGGDVDDGEVHGGEEM